MKILILSQNENLYLPRSIGSVCEALQGDICAIVSAPAMSTHGGPIKGLFRHLGLFGVGGTSVMVWRVLGAKLKNKVRPAARSGPWYSLAGVAKAFAIPFHHVVKVNSPEFQAIVDRYQPDLLISMSCPQIIGKKVRDRFSAGCINVHGAPLPKYRGLMPAFWALRNNEKVTAATVHDLADKLDNGAILVQTQVPIDPSDTWDSLVRKTKDAGAVGLIEACRQIKAGTVQRRPNRDEDASYFSFPTPEDRKVFRAAGRRFF